MKQSDSPSTLRTYCGGAGSNNTDNSTNYYDTTKYVVDVLGEALSKTYRRFPKSRNHGHIVKHCRGLKLSPQGQFVCFFQRLIL